MWPCVELEKKWLLVAQEKETNRLNLNHKGDIFMNWWLKYFLWCKLEGGCRGRDEVGANILQLCFGLDQIQPVSSGEGVCEIKNDPFSLECMTQTRVLQLKTLSVSTLRSNKRNDCREQVRLDYYSLRPSRIQTEVCGLGSSGDSVITSLNPTWLICDV